MEFKSMKYNQPGIDNPEHDFKLKYKNKTMGASSVASLLGFSPFSTPEDLCNKYALEISNDFLSNTAIELGNELEAFILTSAQTELPKAYPQLFGQDHTWIDGKGEEYMSTKFEHLTCNFDGILKFEETGVYVPVEAKRSDAYIVQGDFYSVNNYLYTQLQIQMFMLDAPFGFAIQLSTKTNKFSVEYVPRDERFIQECLFRIKLFFSTDYDLNQNYAWFTPREKEVLQDEKLRELDDAIVEETKLKRQLKEATENVERILQYLGDKEYDSMHYANVKKTKVKHKVTNPNALYNLLKDDETIKCEVKVPVKKLKKLYPDLYNQYVEEIEYEELDGRRNTKGIAK